jgi:hypothetical protein
MLHGHFKVCNDHLQVTISGPVCRYGRLQGIEYGWAQHNCLILFPFLTHIGLRWRPKKRSRKRVTCFLGDPHHLTPDPVTPHHTSRGGAQAQLIDAEHLPRLTSIKHRHARMAWGV